LFRNIFSKPLKDCSGVTVIQQDGQTFKMKRSRTATVYILCVPSSPWLHVLLMVDIHSRQAACLVLQMNELVDEVKVVLVSGWSKKWLHNDLLQIPTWRFQIFV